MPIKENITSLESNLVLTRNVTGNEEHAGQIFDMSKYNNGVAVAMMVVASDGPNTKFTMKFEHGDDPALADAALVPEEMLVYGRKNAGQMPWIQGEMVLGTGSAKLSVEGVFSTKRYLKPSLVVTDWDGTGTAYAYMISYLWPEVVPVPQRLGPVT